MNYRKTYPELLNFVNVEDLKIENIIEFFAENPYKLLYILKNNILLCILSKKHIPNTLKNLNQNLDSDYIWQLDELPTNREIENHIEKYNDLPRIAVVVNKQVLYEVSDYSVLNLSQSLIKDLLAIRYINTFSNSVKEYLFENKINSVLWIGDKSLFDIVSQAINNINIEFKEKLEIKQDLSNYDIIFDNKYYDLLPLFNVKGNFLHFYDFFEKILMQQLFFFTNKNNIKLFLCQLPNFEQLNSCLNELELKQSKDKKSAKELYEDTNYMNSFLQDNDEKTFFLRREYLNCTMLDDGEKAIQSNINADGINIKDGIRKTISNDCSENNNKVFILGTCTAFGFCVSDDKTIASYLQKQLCENGIEYSVYNCGNMQGRFVLNTLITAFQSEVKTGDVILILDYFENYKQSELPMLIQTADWFNEDKDKKHHCFFDYPMHCNAIANKIFANHFYKLIASSKVKSLENKEEQTLLQLSNLSLQDNYNKYYLIPAVFAHLKELKPYKNISGKKGIVIIYACPFTNGHKYLIDEALKCVDHLFVFVVSEYFHGYSMLDRFDMVRDALIHYNNVTVLPTEMYNVSKQYFPEYGKRTSQNISVEKLCYQEKLNAIFLYRSLGITYRFLGEEKEDYVTSIVNREVEKSTAEYGVKCIIIPRKKFKENYISAKQVRTALIEGNIELVKELVPYSTLKHFFSKMFISPKVILLIHKPISEIDKHKIISKLRYIYMDVTCIDADNKIDLNCHLLIHYGLNGIYTKYSTLDYYIETPEDIDTVFISDIIHFYQILSKRVLLYFGKFPSDNGDLDGGSQLAQQLIDTLKYKSILDVSFIRKKQQEYKSSNINKIRYYQYKNPSDNKFYRRLVNIKTNQSAIQNGENYDLIIAAHCSKLFGLSENKQIMNKSIIFPMFLTHSYVKSSEVVPVEYTKEEHKVLSNISLIITPSEEEKNDLIKHYTINNDKIKIIPRGIYIKKVKHNISNNEIRLVSIGSIKLQKNHLEDLKVLLNLIKAGYNAYLYIIGSIYDNTVFEELNSFASENNIIDKVFYYSGLDRNELANLLSSMSFGLSNSYWETFGRGIFECLAAGLPTFVSNKLDTIKRLTKNHEGIYFCSNADEMSKNIIKLYKQPKLYSKMSTCASNISKLFSLEKESERLLYALLVNRFGYRSKFSIWNLEKCKKTIIDNLEVFKFGNNFREYLWNISEVDAVNYYTNISIKQNNSYKANYVAFDCINNCYFIDYILLN